VVRGGLELKRVILLTGLEGPRELAMWLSPGRFGIRASRSIWYVDRHGVVVAVGLFSPGLSLDRLVSAIPLSLN
jgi:hypothetical protein